MRECAGRRAAGSDDGRPVLINSQLFHPRHSAPRRSGGGRWWSGGEEGDAGREGGVPPPPPQRTAATTTSSSFSSSPPHLTFLPELLLLQLERVAHRWRLRLAGNTPLGRSPHTDAHAFQKKKKEKKIGKGGWGWGWGLVIAAVLQSQQWVLTDKSCAEDTQPCVRTAAAA